MELSKRLQAVADLVTEGVSVADIGTDHGYIPIHLVSTGKNPNAIAMDVNEGPLQRAQENIAQAGLEKNIRLRLSNGLVGLEPGEVDAMITAGMGGALVIQILDQSPEVVKELKEFILQPQSELHKVREYLNTHGFASVEENMIKEDGKFYPMMKMIHKEEEPYTVEELYYGRRLLKDQNPVLHEYLQKERKMKEQIKSGLEKSDSDSAKERVAELAEDLRRIQEALKAFDKE